MLTLAAITAFLVVNFTVEPQMGSWLSSTGVIAPIVVVWNIKMGKGARSVLHSHVFVVGKLDENTCSPVSSSPKIPNLERPL